MDRRAANPRGKETHEERFQHDIEELEAGSGWKGILRGVVIVGLAVGAVVAIYLTVGKKPPAPRLSAKGSVIIEPFEPQNGKLSSVPLTFRWEAVSGRSDYVFRVLEKGNPTPLVERTVRENKVSLLPDEAGRLARGTSYLWSVEARGSDGKVLGSGRGFFDL